MRTFIINYNFPEEYKGTYQVTVEDSLTAGMEAAKKVHNYLVEKFGEVKNSDSTVIEVYGTVHKIDYTKDEEWSEEDELMRKRCIADLGYLTEYEPQYKERYDAQIDWLKSLVLDLKKRNENVAKLLL